MRKMPRRVTVPISIELYNRLKPYAKKEGLTVDEFADKLIALACKQAPKTPLFLGDKK